MTLEGIFGPFSKTIARFPVTMLMCFLTFGAVLYWGAHSYTNADDIFALTLASIFSFILAIWAETLPIKHGKRLIPLFSLLLFFMTIGIPKPISNAGINLTIGMWSVIFLLVGVATPFPSWIRSLNRAFMISFIVSLSSAIVIGFIIFYVINHTKIMNSDFDLQAPIVYFPSLIIFPLIFLHFLPSQNLLLKYPYYSPSVRDLLNKLCVPTAITLNGFMVFYYAATSIRLFSPSYEASFFIWLDVIFCFFIWIQTIALEDDATPASRFFRQWFIPCLSLPLLYTLTNKVVYAQWYGMKQDDYLEIYITCVLLCFSFLSCLRDTPPRRQMIGFSLSSVPLIAGPLSGHNLPVEMTFF